jgi:uncharacterized protein (UPF0264 family)
VTKLLVSVRDIEEARIALAAGVDLIDMKDPTKGALGAVAADEANRIAELCGASRKPLSMALGELPEGFPGDVSALDPFALFDDPPPEVPEQVSYVKIGLAGCARRPRWRAQLQLLRRTLDPNTGFVAVVYADGDAVAAPAAEAIIAEAIKLEARAVLVDTAVKDGRTLFDHWSPAQVRRFVDEVQSLGMLAVVGGGLTLTVIPQAVLSGADYVAVRGAACTTDRTSKIDAERIRAIQQLLPRETTLG